MAQPLRHSSAAPAPRQSDILHSLPSGIHRTRTVTEGRHEYQAYRVLQVAFALLPIIVGMDKFTYFLVDWDAYLSPTIPALFGISPMMFMQLVGAIEVFVGLGVAFAPQVFAYILAAWLVGIVANLVSTGMYFDIAARDLGLAAGAVALARLAYVFSRRRRELV